MIIYIVAVIIFLSVLILVHELGHFLTAKKFGLFVEEFGFGLPPRLWGKKIGKTIYSINWLPFGGFVRIFGEDGGDEREEFTSGNFAFQPIWRRAVVIVSGVLMNFLFGWFLMSLVFLVGIPQSIVISDVQPNTPAFRGGIQSGDIVLSAAVDNNTISGGNKLEELVQFINNHRGEEIKLQIKQGDKIKELTLVPRRNPPLGEGALGVVLVEAGAPRQSLFSSLWAGLKASVQITYTIIEVIFRLISQIITEGKTSAVTLTGPVGIVKITGQAAGLGFVYLLQLLSLISLNLAVINILPFPALDGGRLLFLLVEWIKGSPLPKRFEKYANALGMALLLTLMIFITIKDVKTLF